MFHVEQLGLRSTWNIRSVTELFSSCCRLAPIARAPLRTRPSSRAPRPPGDTDPHPRSSSQHLPDLEAPCGSSVDLGHSSGRGQRRGRSEEPALRPAQPVSPRNSSRASASPSTSITTRCRSGPIRADTWLTSSWSASTVLPWPEDSVCAADPVHLQHDHLAVFAFRNLERSPIPFAQWFRARIDRSLRVRRLPIRQTVQQRAQLGWLGRPGRLGRFGWLGRSG